MTREEKMTDLIQMYSYFAQFSNEQSKCHCEALQMAIEALESQRESVQESAQDVPDTNIGKWLGGELGECSVCGHSGCASDIWTGCEKYYCPNCGAHLEV